jgi:hypothetical protein
MLAGRSEVRLDVKLTVCESIVIRLGGGVVTRVFPNSETQHAVAD